MGVHHPPSLQSALSYPQPLPHPQVGPTGDDEMVAVSEVLLEEKGEPASKRARRGTQTKEGARKLATENKRKERERKRVRELGKDKTSDDEVEL